MWSYSFPISFHGVDRESFTLHAACSRMDRSALIHTYETSTGRKRKAGHPLKRSGMLY
jgi:hypothetical protein